MEKHLIELNTTLEAMLEHLENINDNISILNDTLEKVGIAIENIHND